VDLELAPVHAVASVSCNLGTAGRAISGDEPATKSDLSALRAELLAELDTKATKKDLERFATKEDLERFATKEDLERFATKEDLRRFATIEDVRREIERGFAELAPRLAAELRKHLEEDLRQHVNASREEQRRELGAIDDKCDAKARATQEAVDAHVADRAVHVAPRTPTRRSRARQR
jgi:hypothetical protein